MSTPAPDARRVETHSDDTDLDLATLDYISELAHQLRDQALAAGCVTLGGLLDLACSEARLQMLARSASPRRAAHGS